MNIITRRSYNRWYFTIEVDGRELPITSRPYDSHEAARTQAWRTVEDIVSGVLAGAKGDTVVIRDERHHALDPMLGREALATNS